MAELETIADYGTYLPDVSGGDDSLLSPTENVSMNLEPTEENAGIEDEVGSFYQRNTSFIFRCMYRQAGV